MISTKLLDAVMGIGHNNETIDDIVISGNMIEIFYSHPDFGEDEEEMNIYELAHHCKEWAASKGYSLQSGRPIVSDDKGNQVFNFWCKCYIFKINNSCDSAEQIHIETNSKTEPEAIFKACEDILKHS